MKPEVRKYLEDVRASIIEIDAYVDPDLPHGLRLVTLMLPDASVSAARDPEGDTGFRNRVVHDYDLIENADLPQGLRLWTLRLPCASGSAVRDPEGDRTKRIVGFRNRVVHDYDLIENAAVYNILTRSFPLLKEEVERLLADGAGS